jgi:hypothetical protein
MQIDLQPFCSTSRGWMMRLKIETSPNGVEVFKQTVPDGKKWTAILIVDIVEEDA